MDELLRLNNLHVDYRVKEGWLSAVSGVSLGINRGEMLAVVGESGCGKSTVAHAVMRLLDQRNARITGEIIFNGNDLVKYTENQMVSVRGRDIGMIFQNPLDSLNPVYRAGSQVTEAIRLDGVTRHKAREETLRLFSEVRLPDPELQMERFPHELSGGMRQRVMIAMMLSRDPQILIADEPTTALDVTIEAQVINILRELKEQRGTAVMLITHNFGIVAEAADRIAVMYAGQLIEQGTVYEIFKRPAHPYTFLLMQALPSKRKSQGRLRTIEGSVPRLTGENEGCRFANRCPIAKEPCESADPPTVCLGGSHTYKCHFGEEADSWRSR